MKVLILGAGVVGTTSAWYLSKAGHDVTVIDRQPAAGMETSFANGGQISVSHAEPWANPAAPLKALKWLMKEDAPLLFRLRADWRQWLWGMRFLRECTPARTRHNIIQIVNLGLYSRASLQALRRETGIEYDALTKGILHFYTSQREFDAAQAPACIMTEYGCDLDWKSARECVQIEPALAQVEHKIVGGSMTVSDESGDAHKFTQALSRLAERRGVHFDFGQKILKVEPDGVWLDTHGKAVKRTADAIVVALGSYSAPLLRPLGVALDIYPAKGYSVTLPVAKDELAYNVSLTDDEYKLVFSRLGDRMRIAGTAELNGYNTDLNLGRCEAILRRVRELFPGAGDESRATFWTGLRPATPSNVPYIGRTKFPKLFLNTGHGTLGWTHACGSGRALADLVSGRQPEVDFAFTGARPADARSAGAGGQPWRPAPQRAAIGPARRT